MKIKTYILLLLVTGWLCPFAQQQKTSLIDLPDKAIASLTKKYQDIDKQITKETENYIAKLEKQETKLQRKLHTKDSTKAKEQLAGMQEHYKKLRERLKKATTNPQAANEYFPQLDSVATTTKYLLASNPNNAPLKELNQSIASMQGKLQAGAEIKKMMKARKDALRNQLKELGVTKQLDAIGKQTFYYKQQMAEYKALLKDKDKAQQKLLGLVRESNMFKDFMKKNSFLAKLFPQQGNAAEAGSLFGAGLQTREQLMNELQARFGSNNPLANANGLGGGGNFIQDQLNKAKTGFNKLRQDANKAGNNVADADMPNFKPNTQKSKSFLKRLEFGMNMQSVKSNAMLPTTSDIALTVGYKLNDKSTIGIGAAYKLGWGNGWNDIRLSTQGYGIRSFVDAKLFPNAQQGVARLFKSLWISGGCELNYLPELKDKASLGTVQYNAWQESALMGLSKKYSKGKKKAQVQLLYNLLYQQTYPQQAPLVFRVGWGL